MSPDHYLNIVADRSSLYRVDFRSHEVFRIDALCRDNLLSFYYGTQGIVWLGVDGVGVEAYCTDLDPMKTLRSDVMFEECGGAVTSIVQAQDGDIYTSVLGGGLFVLDPKGNPKRPVASEFSEQDRFIFSMVAGPGNTILWVSVTLSSSTLPRPERSAHSISSGRNHLCLPTACTMMI